MTNCILPTGAVNEHPTGDGGRPRLFKTFSGQLALVELLRMQPIPPSPPRTVSPSLVVPIPESSPPPTAPPAPPPSNATIDDVAAAAAAAHIPCTDIRQQRGHAPRESGAGPLLPLLSTGAADAVRGGRPPPPPSAGVVTPVNRLAAPAPGASSSSPLGIGGHQPPVAGAIPQHVQPAPRSRGLGQIDGGSGACGAAGACDAQSAGVGVPLLWRLFCFPRRLYVAPPQRSSASFQRAGQLCRGGDYPPCC